MTLKELIAKDIDTFRAAGKFVVTAGEMAKSLRRASPSVRRAMAEMAAAGLLKKLADGYVHPGVKVRRGKVVETAAPAPVAPVAEPTAPPVVDGETLPDPEVGDEPFEAEDEDSYVVDNNDSTDDALDNDDVIDDEDPSDVNDD